jgi:ribosome-associated protein
VHVDALADGVIDAVRQDLGAKPWNKEGFENAEWILLDYADVVVHIFQENSRHFYNLEDLWADMDITRIKSKA